MGFGLALIANQNCSRLISLVLERFWYLCSIYQMIILFALQRLMHFFACCVMLGVAGDLYVGRFHPFWPVNIWLYEHEVLFET